MTIPIGVQLEMENALQDAKDIIDERGNDITLLDNTESTVERDSYGEIIRRVPTQYTMHAYPVIYNPTQDELEKAGIKENVELMVTLAVKDLTNIGITYDDIDNIRFEVAVNVDPLTNTDSQLYIIKDKNNLNMFSHTYLNVVLGLFKK